MKFVNAICIAVLFYLVAPAITVAEPIGPYSGTVLDATTGKPVEGVSVLFYWRKRIPQPMGSSSDLIDAKLTLTNTAGKYELPFAFANTGLSGSLDSTHVIIYQPGYKAYMKLIWHDSPYAKPDPEFQNRGNVVRLERIPPDFDHKTHYEQIAEALRLMERHDYASEQEQGWEGIVKRGLKTAFEGDQLLRRVEWEQRRPGREGRR